MFIICRRQTEVERLKKVLQGLNELDATQKQLLEYRYLNLLHEFSNRCKRYSILFHIGHFIITVGSLIVPALLSVQYADVKVGIVNEQIQAQIYWITWVLSLLVTTFNGILVLYKVDKKYYFLHTTRERLRSEGWQYFQLTGRYAGGLSNYTMPSTHKNQFVFFCHYVEKIRMRQIEEEYYKHEESNQPNAIQSTSTAQQNGENTGQTKDLYPPSISEDLKRLNDQKPPVIHHILSKLIRAQSEVSPPQPTASIMKKPSAVFSPISSKLDEETTVIDSDDELNLDSKNTVIEPKEDITLQISSTQEKKDS
jgi:hypothetical protein